nr:MAG TPA: hypothetical protein [Bacteriophage sp.]
MYKINNLFDYNLVFGKARLFLYNRRSNMS